MEWLLWVDVETTGLNADKHDILQIACVLTDFALTIQHTFGQRTIQQQLSLDDWDPWCREQHKKSNLYNDVQMSTLTTQDAEKSILCWLNSFLGVRDVVYIAGNSVHFDKQFIDKHMPRLSQRISYRIVDVTSFSLVCKHINPDVYETRPKKEYNHTALDDILESINEYKYYLDKPQKIE
jgi:oligoribonuclease